MSINKTKLKSYLSFLNPSSVGLDCGETVSDTPAVFIGGCGRSGTTLLRVMLGKHSQLYGAPEFNVHATVVNKLIVNKSLLPKKAYLLYDDIVLGTMSGKYDRSIEELSHIRDESRCVWEFLDTLFSQNAERSGKKRWMEKTPKNVTVLPYIFKYFPKAKFIHVVRDGRDVVCSLKHHPRFVTVNGRVIENDISRPIEYTVGRWVGDVSAGLAFRGDDRYTEVKYEDLVHQPKQELQKISTFLDIKYEEGMLDYGSDDEQKKKLKDFLPSANAVKPLESKSIMRWKRDMSCEEAEYFKDHAGGLLKALKYAGDDSWLDHFSSQSV